MNLGTIVQKSSSLCDSNICWSTFVLNNVEDRLKPTIEMIRIKIVKVWSWKKINCSIKGEEAFWKPMADHDAISKGNFFLKEF